MLKSVKHINTQGDTEMDRTHTTQKLTVLALILLFTIISVAGAQDTENPALQPPKPPSGMSGKVVDSEGNPVAGFTFIIQPMKLRKGLLQPEGDFMPQFQMPPEGMEGPGMPRTTTKVQTDPDGTFTVANIQPGLVQFKRCFG